MEYHVTGVFSKFVATGKMEVKNCFNEFAAKVKAGAFLENKYHHVGSVKIVLSGVREKKNFGDLLDDFLSGFGKVKS